MSNASRVGGGRRTGGGAALGVWSVPAPGGAMSTPVVASEGRGADAVWAGADAGEAAVVGSASSTTVETASAGAASATSAPASVLGAGAGGGGGGGVARAGGWGRAGGLGATAGFAATGATAATAATAAAGGGGAAMLRVRNTLPTGDPGVAQASGTPLRTSQCRASTRTVMRKSARRGIYLRAGAVRRCPRPDHWRAGPQPCAAARRWRRPTRGRRWQWSPAW